MNEQIHFSVILSVCHGGAFLENALLSLARVDFPPAHFEVIVAGARDDAESKAVAQAVSSETALTIVYRSCGEKNRPELLNAGCEAARGRVFVFADDDCVFRKDWLKNLARALDRETDVGVVGGGDEFEGDGSSFSYALDFVLNSFLGTGGLRKGDGLRIGKYYPKLWNMAVPRTVVLQNALTQRDGRLRIFDESLRNLEDIELVNRIQRSGKRIVYSSEAGVGHCRNTTFSSFVKRNFAMARTARTLGVHRNQHAALGAFALTMSVLALGSAFAHSLRLPWLLVCSLYALVLLTEAARGYRRTRDPQVFAMIPMLLVGLHFARGLGFIYPFGNERKRDSL